MTKIDIISGFLGAGKTTFIKKQTTDTVPDERITPEKLLNTRMEVRAGKMIRLEPAWWWSTWGPLGFFP